jgi:hypothetical protein
MKRILVNIYNKWCKLLVYIFYPQKKELASWNACATKKYIFFQKILNVNDIIGVSAALSPNFWCTTSQ